MKLSVIIVNYNVENFLEQCLSSVRQASKGLAVEVYVVDNNSVDGSLRMLAEKFPEVKLIANKQNVGFSRANNQAIRVSTGEYVLLLNPDTVVEDDTFSKVINFMDSHPDAGGLGVKMVDGRGRFLPESKRGLPTPMTAFYKIFGLLKLFPHSKRFGRYYMGHLSENETNPVEILAGAFMLLRRAALDKCGLLDETFFMYGEDIDLSYRITLAGYKNYYFPETRIIHYKGESTKKTSVNYVFVFYNAMKIFARKHFGKKRAGLFSFCINCAIYFRAFLALISQFLHKAIVPLLDIVLGYFGILLISRLWGNATIYSDGGSYPLLFEALIIPIYLIVWFLAVFLSGGYDKPYRLPKSILGVAIGSILILIFYALLPESMRFSRILILFSMLWLTLETSLTRALGYLLKLPGFLYGRNLKKRFLIIGSEEETIRVEKLMESTSIKPDFVGLVTLENSCNHSDKILGNMTQVPDIITIYKISEIIFCSKDVSHQMIIDKMMEWHASNVDYKIAPENSFSIIGSNSINTRGDLYTIDVNAIDKVENRRNKRVFDVLSSLFCVVFWLPMAIFIKSPFSFIKKSLSVLFGYKTWVGYCPDEATQSLPKIRQGIMNTASRFPHPDKTMIQQLNLLYARDYTVVNDIVLFFKMFGKI